MLQEKSCPTHQWSIWYGDPFEDFSFKKLWEGAKHSLGDSALLNSKEFILGVATTRAYLIRYIKMRDKKAKSNKKKNP